MKKLFRDIILFVAFMLVPSMALADMTDNQIISFVQQQVEMGTPRAQIVTKLMQNGVDIQRIRSLYNKYQKEKNGGALDAVDITTGKAAKKDRLRKANGDAKEDGTKTKGLIKENKVQTDPNVDINEMDKAIDFMMPDSLKYEFEPMEEEMPGRKVFGRDIFNKKNLTFEPNMNIATPQNYRLGPGDEVNIDIWGASSNTITETISPDGTVTIEGFGPVGLSGLTVAQAKAKLKSTLGQRYKSSSINMTVGQTKTITVNVMGEVNMPGTYTLSAFASVFHALYMAGGPNEIGTLRNIKVYRGGRLVSAVDVYDYILNGKLTGDVKLQDNDVISVGTYEALVNIAGKIKRPMFYEMKKSESLRTLLKYAGNFTGDAYKKAVKVTRKAEGHYSIFDVNEFDLSSFHLEDEDSVYVDSIIQRYSNMIEVKGAVFRPGKYQVGGSINSVKSLITSAGGCMEEAFTGRAVLHRRKADRSLEAMSIDIKGIMDGTSPDVPLQNEDVLFVGSKQENIGEKTMTIHGEVFYPGVYEYAENTTLEDFILQAGGLKASASTVKIDVSRRIQNKYATTSSLTTAETFSFSLKDGLVVDGNESFKLQPFDEVYVRKSPGFTEQQNVNVEGEILFEGAYTLSNKMERLSEVINKAGGLTSTAYAKGARLERKITPEERMRMQSVMKMAQHQSGKDSVDVSKLDIGDTYYVGIELDKALKEPGGDADIVLREGDRIIIPEYTGTVRIQGDVMYPNTIAYQKGKDVSYYIKQAGGYSNTAKKNKTYIINMNGTVEKVTRSTKPSPGCEIVVPAKSKHKMTTAEMLAIGTSSASLATMIASIANLIK
ncbi:MAG: SLBB domain-containing protein [Prevotellaceae bacterium]|nr:SLBB domain-containing protein [Prevotellaceae bacterium]